MPIEVGLWRIGKQLERVKASSLSLERSLEDHIVADPSILAPQLLVLGRQVATAYGSYIDILAMDPLGKLVVVELKRDRTPREVVAQLLDYASWVQALTHEEICTIFEQQHAGQKLEVAFADAFAEEREYRRRRAAKLGGLPAVRFRLRWRRPLVQPDARHARSRVTGLREPPEEGLRRSRSRHVAGCASNGCPRRKERGTHSPGAPARPEDGRERRGPRTL